MVDELIDEVLRKLTSLEDGINNRKAGWSERIFWAIEKAVIPVMIAATAYFGNQAAARISEGQLALAKSNSDDRKSEFQRTMQGKYLEMFYRDITSSDPRQQSNAMTLLTIMDPALARDVAIFVQSSPNISAIVKEEVRVESQKIEASAQVPTRPKGTGVLAGYSIGVYFLATDSAAARTARAVQDHLKQQGLSNPITLLPRTPEFMDRVNPPSSLEVRFEEGVEDQQAKFLVEALSAKPLEKTANQVRVATTTPNFVSIFVPSGG